MVEKRQIILASHGEFSKGLKHSLEMILGNMANQIRVYSLYPGENASDFQAALEKEIAEHTDTEYVILTDVFGGSVCNALMILAGHENVKVFAGMNFNLVTELLMQSIPLTEEAVRDMLDTARSGIMQVVLDETLRMEEDF